MAVKNPSGTVVTGESLEAMRQKLEFKLPDLKAAARKASKDLLIMRLSGQPLDAIARAVIVERTAKADLRKVGAELALIREAIKDSV